MRKGALIFAWAALCIFSTVCIAQSADKTPEQFVKEAKQSINEVPIGDVKHMIESKESFILLDVRDKHEFEDGYIPGAMNISRGSLEFKVAMMIPDKNAKIVVYCGLDIRSPLAVRALNELGYKNAVNMTGGLKAWKEAGFSTAK